MMPPAHNRLRHLLKRIVTPPMLIVAVLLVILEEHLWRWLQAMMAALGRLPMVRTLEARIAALPPKGAMAVFLVPPAVIFPFKVAAVWAMATGHLALGLGVLITAKVTATALLARLYALCEPKLMQVDWFVRLRAWVLRAKAWAHAKLNGWPAWRLARRLFTRAHAGIRNAGLMVRRWRSIRRHISS